MTTVYTVGHSNHTWESFGPLIAGRGIQVMVDVRTNPVSRRAPFASARRLPELLAPNDIRYVHMGGTLGGKPSDPALYDDRGNPDYARMGSTETFKQGIEELMGLLKDSVVVLMCAEENPAKCHRNLLVGAALKAMGVELRHIRKDGTANISQ